MGNQERIENKCVLGGMRRYGECDFYFGIMNYLLIDSIPNEDGNYKCYIILPREQANIKNVLDLRILDMEENNTQAIEITELKLENYENKRVLSFNFSNNHKKVFGKNSDPFRIEIVVETEMIRCVLAKLKKKMVNTHYFINVGDRFRR